MPTSAAYQAAQILIAALVRDGKVTAEQALPVLTALQTEQACIVEAERVEEESRIYYQRMGGGHQVR